MKSLLTGASGYVGAKIYEDLKRKSGEIIGTYHLNKLFDDLVKLDITNESAVSSLIREVQPEYIIHAAASTIGLWCEKNPDQAFVTNCQATEFLVEAANKNGSKVIFLSSSAVVNPEGVYGRTKVYCEQIVQGVKAGYVILRPSLILGVSPNHMTRAYFNKLFKNIREGDGESYDPVLEFKPTWLQHVSEVVECILEKGILNETIPISVPESVTRYDFANDIAKYFNVQVTSRKYPHILKNYQKDISKLTELGLPYYNYSEIVRGIIGEIESNMLSSKYKKSLS